MICEAYLEAELPRRISGVVGVVLLIVDGLRCRRGGGSGGDVNRSLGDRARFRRNENPGRQGGAVAGRRDARQQFLGIATLGGSTDDCKNSKRTCTLDLR